MFGERGDNTHCWRVSVFVEVLEEGEDPRLADETSDGKVRGTISVPAAKKDEKRAS